MIEFWKNDFARVRAMAKFATNDKMPDWLIVVMYILLLPFGLMLLPFALIFKWYVMRQISKVEKDESA